MAPRSALLDVTRTLLRPGPSADYDGPRAAWLDVDWAAHRRSVRVGDETLQLVELGEGPPVLLVHGLGAAWPVWVMQLPALAATRRVIALDLPGFGGSPMPAGPISLAGYARTVAALLGALGIERAAVVGHSLGGLVAAELALRRPALVQRLALAAPAVLWGAYRRSRVLVALAGRAEAHAQRDGTPGEPAPVPRRPRLRATAVGGTGIHVPQRLAPELQVELLRLARRTPGYLDAMRALRGLDLRDELERIACPTLLLWGDHDTILGVSDAATIAAPIPDARTVVLHGAGHRPMLEFPEAFNAELLDFL